MLWDADEMAGILNDSWDCSLDAAGATKMARASTSQRVGCE
jgi:hypothetical protein